jgi:hypothetical protein
MVAAGKDKGSYSFEIQTLLKHIKVYDNIFTSLFQTKIKVSFNRNIIKGCNLRSS